MFKMLISKL